MTPHPDNAQRPLTRKGLQTRRRIVQAAADLTLEKGVAQTTIEDVRAAANVSSSQLYHYFVDKPDLIRAVIEFQTDAIIENQRRFDLSSLTGLRDWRNWVVDYQRSLNCQGGCPIGSLGSELAETEPQARADVAAGFERWHDEIRSGLRQMQELGRLSPDADPDELALATLTALQGGLLLTQIERGTRALEAGLDAMISLIASQSAAEPDPATAASGARS